jgi:hypothetical protein
MAQDRVQGWGIVNMVMNFLAPESVGNFLTSWSAINFWGRTLLHEVHKQQFVFIHCPHWHDFHSGVTIIVQLFLLVGHILIPPQRIFRVWYDS